MSGRQVIVLGGGLGLHAFRRGLVAGGHRVMLFSLFEMMRSH